MADCDVRNWSVPASYAMRCQICTAAPCYKIVVDPVDDTHFLSCKCCLQRLVLAHDSALPPPFDHVVLAHDSALLLPFGDGVAFRSDDVLCFWGTGSLESWLSQVENVVIVLDDGDALGDHDIAEHDGHDTGDTASNYGEN